MESCKKRKFQDTICVHKDDACPCHWGLSKKAEKIVKSKRRKLQTKKWDLQKDIGQCEIEISELECEVAEYKKQIKNIEIEDAYVRGPAFIEWEEDLLKTLQFSKNYRIHPEYDGTHCIFQKGYGRFPCHCCEFAHDDPTSESQRASCYFFESLDRQIKLYLCERCFIERDLENVVDELDCADGFFQNMKYPIPCNPAHVTVIKNEEYREDCYYSSDCDSPSKCDLDEATVADIQPKPEEDQLVSDSD